MCVSAGAGTRNPMPEFLALEPAGLRLLVHACVSASAALPPLPLRWEVRRLQPRKGRE